MQCVNTSRAKQKEKVLFCHVLGRKFLPERVEVVIKTASAYIVVAASFPS